MNLFLNSVVGYEQNIYSEQFLIEKCRPGYSGSAFFMRFSPEKSVQLQTIPKTDFFDLEDEIPVDVKML